MPISGLTAGAGAGMISISKYLRGKNQDEGAEALQRMVRLMLQAMILHRVEGDQSDDERFRTELEKVDHALNAGPDPKEIFFLTGSTIKIIEEHGRQLKGFLNVRGLALQNMLRMATDAITSISTGCDRSTRRLQDLEAKIERAGMIEDIHTLKAQLAECLGTLQEEMHDRRAESASTVQSINVTTSAAAKIAPVETDQNDPVTGLPGAVQARAHLESISANFNEIYVVVFVLNRIQSINNRYGYGMGDRILATYGEYLTKQFSASDRLFRWRGPAIVAIPEREQGEQMIRREVMRIGAAKLDRDFEFESRTVLLPISASWTLLPAAGNTVDALFQKVGEFVQSCLAKG